MTSQDMEFSGELYPPIEPRKHGMLSVSKIHILYWEECGNPEGIPVVFLHGGPGAGCSANDRRFFDPQKWRIILFDQRGSGRSTPFCDTRENTTWHLVEDIRHVLAALHVERAAFFGGSWGSTLALTYALTHPETVTGLVLRGIYLSSVAENDHYLRGAA